MSIRCEILTESVGPIVRLSLAGDDMVILNDSEDAEELVNNLLLELERHSLRSKS